MDADYQDIRKKAEADGYKVDDDTFRELIEYARRKAKVAGRDESYLPFLLPDVIKEWYIRRAINVYSLAMVQIQKYY